MRVTLICGYADVYASVHTNTIVFKFEKDSENNCFKEKLHPQQLMSNGSYLECLWAVIDDEQI